MNNLNSILFVLPFFPRKTGGVEVTLRTLNTDYCTPYLLTLFPFAIYTLNPLRHLSVINIFSIRPSYTIYYYWNTVFSFPLLRLLFHSSVHVQSVNHSHIYKSYKRLFFLLSINFLKYFVFDSFNSLSTHREAFDQLNSRTCKVVPCLPAVTIYDHVPKHSKKHDIICVSRWSPEKGTHLLSSFSKLLNRSITFCSSTRPPHSDLDFLAYVDGTRREVVFQQLLQHKLHVLLSQSEGLSIVSYEALACSCLPVSLASTEISDCVKNYFNCHPKSIAEFGDFVLFLLNLSDESFDNLITMLRNRYLSALTTPYSALLLKSLNSI